MMTSQSADADKKEERGMERMRIETDEWRKRVFGGIEEGGRNKTFKIQEWGKTEKEGIWKRRRKKGAPESGKIK